MASETFDILLPADQGPYHLAVYEPIADPAGIARFGVTFHSSLLTADQLYGVRTSPTGRVTARNTKRVEVEGVFIEELWAMDARNLSRDTVFNGRDIWVTLDRFAYDIRPPGHQAGITGTGLGLRKIRRA